MNLDQNEIKKRNQFETTVFSDMFCKQLLEENLPDEKCIYAQTVQLFTESPSINILLQQTKPDYTAPTSSTLSVDSRQEIINLVQQSFPSIQDQNNDNTTSNQFGRQSWSTEMIEKLNTLMLEGLSFVKITDALNKQFNLYLKPNQVSQRWNRVQNPNIKKGRWIQEDVDKLNKLIRKNLSAKEILAYFQDRTLLQIQKKIKLCQLEQTMK